MTLRCRDCDETIDSVDECRVWLPKGRDVGIALCVSCSTSHSGPTHKPASLPDRTVTPLGGDGR